MMDDSIAVEVSMDGDGSAALPVVSSTGSKKAGKAVNEIHDQFPVGLRVLVVDDDPVCLRVTEKSLQSCMYQVTVSNRAAAALSMLRERKDGFDLVLSDVHMPDMDGFKLLELIGLEMDLPVIMMSNDDRKDIVMKGVIHGACDYLIKPVKMEALKNIWQHVIRKKRNELKDMEHPGSVEESDRNNKASDDGDYASSINEENWRNSKRRKDVKDEVVEVDDQEDSSTLKKPRVVWSADLHQQFVAAVNQLGVDKAVPKKILELMSIPGLTRENVASHLQKYRQFLKRLNGVPENQTELNSPLTIPRDGHFNSIGSIDRLDIQALAVSSQLQPENPMSLQVTGRPNSSTAVSMPLVGQMKHLIPDSQIRSSEKLKYAPVQLSNKHVSLFQCLPTSIDPKQLVHVHQHLQAHGNFGLQVSAGASNGSLSLPPQRVGSSGMSHFQGIPGSYSLGMQLPQQTQQLPVGQNPCQIQADMIQKHNSGRLVLNEVAGGHAFNLPSTPANQILHSEMAGSVGRSVPVVNGRITLPEKYFISNNSSENFPLSNVSEWPENMLPLVTTETFHETMSATGRSEGWVSGAHLKSSGLSCPSHDVVGKLQNSSQSWELQSMNHTNDTIQRMNFLTKNAGFDLHNQDSRGLQKTEQTRSEYVHHNIVTQSANYVSTDNSFIIKADGTCGPSVIIDEHFAQDDLLTSLYKEQQDEDDPAERDFSFDGYPMDNTPF